MSRGPRAGTGPGRNASSPAALQPAMKRLAPTRSAPHHRPSVAARRAAVTLAAALALPAGAELRAQDDVAALGAVYGTPVPETHRAFLARNPEAFRFSRALLRRNPGLELVDPGTPEGAGSAFRAIGAAGDGHAHGAGLAAIGPRDEAVEGAFTFPVILGYFADQGAAPPFDGPRVQQEYFDGPNSYYKTVSEYYDEISRGRVQLDGVTFAWRQSPLTQAETAAGLSGLGGSRVGDFIRSLLDDIDDGSIDWGQFDNDGPDGVPNSGDDDGFVDVLTVVHSTHGAECGGDNANRVWSHRWNLSAASQGYGPYATRTPSASGGNIRINDYTIQPIFACDAASINEIGVFAHELGHGFGLPDLYCTSSGCPANGIGSWGLMGQGAWGCGPTNPAYPCHMNAWSKAMLGWVDVVSMAPGEDHGEMRLPPVGASGQVVRVDAQDGSGEYYLLENRRRTGFDAELAEEGLLVWHVNPERVFDRWSFNGVNSIPGDEGVALVQADGRWDLANGVNRRDAGDVFPGATNSTAFHAGTVPASVTRDGNASAVTLLDIALDGDDVRLRLVNRYQTVEVRAQGTDDPSLVSVDGEPLPLGGTTFASAPFEEHVLTAAPGQVVAEGVRRAFEAWSDDDAAPRSRTIVTGFDDASYVAVFGGEEVRVMPEFSGAALGVLPGSLTSVPASDDLWYPTGTRVQFSAVAASGFSFLGWGGALAGRDNPLTLDVDQPLTVRATFGLSFQGLVDPLLTQTVLEPALATALDEFGNSNGAYDVGDLRAYLVRRNPDLAPQEIRELMREALSSRRPEGGR